jgi:hypothetical protein
MQEASTIDQALERLCEIVEDEAERQENVLAVCRAQHAAVLSNDAQELEARTAALAALIRDAAEAEGERLQVVGEVVEHYQLPAERQTMTQLVRMAPVPWRNRLREAQRRLQIAMRTSRGLTRSTGRALRWSAQAVERCIGGLKDAQGVSSQSYSAGGEVQTPAYSRPAFVDQKG